jgi:pectate lyase
MERKVIFTVIVAAGVLAVFLFASAVVVSLLLSNLQLSRESALPHTLTPFQPIGWQPSVSMSPSAVPTLVFTSTLYPTSTNFSYAPVSTSSPRPTNTRVPAATSTRTRTNAPAGSRTVTRTRTLTRTITQTSTATLTGTTVIQMTSTQTLTRTATQPQPSPTVNPEKIPAFPGAEGFGAQTTGGRGGRVIEVTNLNDSGSGSLREAVNASGARIVVFRVAGTIGLNTPLRIANPFITIAGQSAPGGGITLRPLSAQADPLMEITAHDVVVRYLTFRGGPPSAGDDIAIVTQNHQTYNIVMDHISASWAVGRNLMTWYDVHDITFQWSILSEGLDCSINPKGCHSKGALLGGYASDENKDQPGAYDFSFHHNLMAHNAERNPLVTMSGVCDVVNNVSYNPRNAYGQVDMQEQLTQMQVNFMGNYFKAGPNTDSGEYGVSTAHEGALGAEIYVRGNLGFDRMDDSQPEENIVEPAARGYVVAARNPAPGVGATSAGEAFANVLAQAGSNRGLNCDGSIFNRRDAIDARVVSEVQNGGGQIIDSPSQVGGYLTIPAAAACPDGDHDGMPDAWENTHGFNPTDPADALLDFDADGYANIEEFLNGTAP